MDTSIIDCIKIKSIVFLLIIIQGSSGIAPEMQEKGQKMQKNLIKFPIIVYNGIKVSRRRKSHGFEGKEECRKSGSRFNSK